MVTILEALADYAPVTNDTDMHRICVRRVGRAISRDSSDQNTSVITLDPKLEQLMLDSLQKRNRYIPDIEPGHESNTREPFETGAKLVQLGKQPIVLASPVVRLYFRKLADQAIPGIVVLSYNELDPELEIQSAGVVSI